jgi:hypothetical protein
LDSAAILRLARVKKHNFSAMKRQKSFHALSLTVRTAAISKASQTCRFQTPLYALKYCPPSVFLFLPG